jgi:siroheme synthase
MTVHFIGAGPGAADLITVRGRDILARSPVCLYAGSIMPKELLDYCPQGCADRRYRVAVAGRYRGGIRGGTSKPARMSRGCIRAIFPSGAPSPNRSAGWRSTA